MDNDRMECPICGTSVKGDPSRFGNSHAEFSCSYCNHNWLGDISDEDINHALYTEVHNYPLLTISTTCNSGR